MAKISKKVLLLAIICFTNSQNARADFNFGIHTGFPYTFGLQFGYNPTNNQAGFGFRGTIEGVAFIGLNFTLSGYYYLPVADSGSGFYFGLGAGLYPTSSHLPCSPAETSCYKTSIGWEFHPLIGFNWQFIDYASLFVELQEVFFVNGGKISTNWWPFPIFGMIFYF